VAAILIVEDEARMRRLLELDLGEAGYQTFSAADAEKGLDMLRREQIDLVLTDLKLPGLGGLEFLQAAKRLNGALPVVVMTAYGSVETAVEAMKAGASDYVLKPFALAEMRLVVQKELDVRRLREENLSLREALGRQYNYPNIVARSPKMQEVLALAERVAATPSTVLIGGESGVGKDLIARLIHQRSSRASGPFIKINSTAIPENLLESELFGHEKGAFTGASAQRIGRFEQSNGGTLFLDEIGDMPLAVQSKILRVLQEGEFSRVGGNTTVKTDVRIIAATNKTLEQEVAKKQFREDLFYRLNVVRIHLPPLRQRREDVNLLAEYFLKKIATQKHLPQLKLSEEAVKLMEEYPWPGNVRELENTIQRACVLATSDVLLPKDIPLGAATQQSDGASENLAVAVNSNPVRPTLETAVEILLDAASTDRSLQLLPWLEREFTLFAMKRTKGNQVKAAKLLGVTRATLRKRIERYGITRELNFQ